MQTAQANAYQSRDCSGAPTISSYTVDGATGCTVVPDSPYYYVTDCTAMTTDYFSTADCSGVALFSYPLSGMQGSTCQNAGFAACQAYFRALDCSECATSADQTLTQCPDLTHVLTQCLDRGAMRCVCCVL